MRPDERRHWHAVSRTSPREPVAHWDFRDGPHVTDRVHSERMLRHSAIGRVVWTADDEVGGCMVFDGHGGHLRLPPEEIGDLDLSEAGAATVMALVRRDGLGRGFIAGSWQEHDSEPRRQYGMFIDLPAYGGADQVIGHVSHSGGASPNLPYSRDYAASARMVRPGAWRVIAFRYDGTHITAFLDGLADPRPEFQEVGPPVGEGLRYAKNPYRFEEGLYRGPLGDFTVGAVLLSEGIGNAFCGRIAELGVWARALTDDEIQARTAEWTPHTMPIVSFDWWREVPDPARAPEKTVAWPLESAGARQTRGRAPVMVHPGRLVRSPARDDAVVELPLVPAARRVEIEGISDERRLRVAVRHGDRRSFLEQTEEPGIWSLPGQAEERSLEIWFGAGGHLSTGPVRLLRRPREQRPGEDILRLRRRSSSQRRDVRIPP